MSEKIKIKVSQPMFEDGELERFDTYINEIASEFTKLHFEEKDKILTQRLVQKLEQENERLHSIIKEVREYINSNEFIGRIKLSSENKKAINKLLEILDKVGEDNE